MNQQAVLEVSIFGTGYDLRAVQCAPGLAKHALIGLRVPVSTALLHVSKPNRSPGAPRLYMHTGPLGGGRRDPVRCNREPVSNSRLRSRKITTNRKVSRYGSQFRTCRAQVKFCESAHAAARLEESGTPQRRTGERFREPFG
jgi:hypothetical protein